MLNTSPSVNLGVDRSCWTPLQVLSLGVDRSCWTPLQVLSMGVDRSGFGLVLQPVAREHFTGRGENQFNSIPASSGSKLKKMKWKQDCFYNRLMILNTPQNLQWTISRGTSWRFAMAITVPWPDRHQKCGNRPQKSSACMMVQKSHRPRSLL